MAVVDASYEFTPTAYTSGKGTAAETANPAGTNSGSCKCFAFAKERGLSEAAALRLFCEHYEQVLGDPDGDTHLNIRAFQANGHDSALFEFALPEGARALGLPTCACLLARAPGCEHGGGDAVRPYTPVAETPAEEGEGEDGGGGDRAGSFTLLVKRYAAWGDPRHAHSYRPAGAVSNHVFGLVPGVDSLEFKHVPGNVKLPYAHPCGARGFRTAAGERVRTITMVAVGVGVAPMAQALREMLDDGADDDTRVVLLYGNRSVRDILLRDTLDEWEERHPERFKVVHHIGSRFGYNVHMHFDDCPKDCGKPCKRRRVPVPEGFDTLREDRREFSWVNEDTIRRHAFPPACDTKVFVCGLPSVYDKLCGPRGAPLAQGSALANLGYTDDMILKF
eukprot:PRCOL_00005404-RA